MNVILSLAWLFILLAVGGWAIGYLASELVSRFVFRGELSPVARRSYSFTLATLPLLAMAALVVAVVVTALGKSLGWMTDHCVYHGPGHPHLCFRHLPAIDLGVVEFVAAALLLAGITYVIIGFGSRQYRAGKHICSLLRLVEGRIPDRRVHTVESLSPFAVTAGAFSPRVILSRGLLDRLEARERRIVLAHEVSHVRTRDLLYNGVFEILLLLHLPVTASRLRKEWRQALEEIADDRVAGHFGREEVAATLLKVFRLQRGEVMPGLSVAGADAVKRIERLLCPADNRRNGRVFVSVSLAAIFALSLSSAGAHHELETLLGLLTGH
ncbi:M56 family metallopeptidase [Microbulbifer sediminum]|uniref:M56 family metallopeptidase n=1 Tax=Microbulbifer sediminum TaxID=2904250 RepID=UPI001F38B4E7|nr:M56 family metallopeptidase [Microbulbifer sediminum]